MAVGHETSIRESKVGAGSAAHKAIPRIDLSITQPPPTINNTDNGVLVALGLSCFIVSVHTKHGQGSSPNR